MGEQDFGGVAHLAQAAFEHLEDADFVRGAETVLDAAQQAVGVVAVALELEHHVHDVSRIFGPAIVPSLVMWPMMKIDVPVLLAYLSRVAAHSRICDTLPAEDSIRSV